MQVPIPACDPLLPCLQLRYMLGMRNRDHSYVVGTGKGPKRPGDRAASCPLDFDVECNRWAALQCPAVCMSAHQLPLLAESAH